MLAEWVRLYDVSVPIVERGGRPAEAREELIRETNEASPGPAEAGAAKTGITSAVMRMVRMRRFIPQDIDTHGDHLKWLLLT